MEPTLLIIGVNRSSAPEQVRSRFALDADRRQAALEELGHTEAIDEVVVVSNEERTDFVLWTHDASAASASVLAFLTHHYELTIADWTHFYRKVHEAALDYLFRLVAGLDSTLLAPNAVVTGFEIALQAAHQAHGPQPALESVLAKAFAMAAEAGTEGLTKFEIAQEARTFYAELAGQHSPAAVPAARA